MIWQFFRIYLKKASFPRIIEPMGKQWKTVHVCDLRVEGGIQLKADAITKSYVQDVNIFADIFNYYIYKGKQVIKPEELIQRDPTKIALPYGADGAAHPVQKFRDVQKLYAAMTDGKTEYVLYGVENQSRVHYAMPVRNYLYDALEYVGQVDEAAKSHKKEREERKKKEEKAGEPEKAGEEGKKIFSDEEFLSGFWKEDRLIPSITVTILFSPKPWNGPLSLFDMMEVSDPAVQACMDNYHLRLIAPAQMADEEIMKFQSSLREVMLFIKYSENKDELSQMLENNKKRFGELERRAAEVIKAVTNSGMKYKKSEEVVDMCKAIQDMQIEARKEGEERGKQIGEQRGKQIGEQIGELRKAKESAKKLYEMGLATEEIAQVVGYPAEVVEGW